MLKATDSMARMSRRLDDLELRIRTLEKRTKGSPATAGALPHTPVPEHLYPQPEIVMEIVAYYYSVSVEAIKGNRSLWHHVWPRQMAITICRDLGYWSRTEIAAAFRKEKSYPHYAAAKVAQQCGIHSGLRGIYTTLLDRARSAIAHRIPHQPDMRPDDGAAARTHLETLNRPVLNVGPVTT